MLSLNASVSSNEGMATEDSRHAQTFTTHPGPGNLSATQDADANPLSCNICGRSYTRLDHLVRHFRSHTKEKPFTCSVCQKSFARADLLKRHCTNHDDPASRPDKRQKQSQHGRVRASQACMSCADAKLRCQGSNPCTRCEQKKLLCRYAPAYGRKSPSKHESVTRLHDQRETGVSTSQAPMPEHDGSIAPVENSASNGLILQEFGEQQVHGSALRSPFQEVMPNGVVQVQQPEPVTADPSYETFDNNQPLPEMDLGYGDSSLAEFLRDIMMPFPPTNDLRPNKNDTLQHFSPKDVLDFGVNYDFDFEGSSALPTMLGAGQAGQISNIGYGDQSRPISRSGYTTPYTRAGIRISAQAFKESLWSFEPVEADHRRADQMNLSLPFEDLVSPTRCGALDPPCAALDQISRDRLLAMILSTCEQSVVLRILSSFPGAELLTNLLHNFLFHHMEQIDTWIHLPTLEPCELSPEVLLPFIAAGAALSGIPVIRKLGYAFQEASRESTSKMFEQDNRNIRSLRPLQAFAVQLDVGLWSGDRRKMEIAESFAHPLITMLRRNGRFRQTMSPANMPTSTDTLATIETKWRAWVEEESYKRLAMHILIRDAQTSLSLLTPPLVSYAEFFVTMPSPIILWNAKTAQEWKDLYLAIYAPGVPQMPSLRTFMTDLSSISSFQMWVDIQASSLSVLSGLWSLSWQYREWRSMLQFLPSTQSRYSALIATSLYQEILQILEQFEVVMSDLPEHSQPTASILLQQQLMNLHVSLEDVQLLAGKAGEKEARRVLPLLTAWAQGQDARQAVWHAGQILRVIKESSARPMESPSAVAVYHASLVFWAYSIVSSSSHASEIARRQDPSTFSGNLSMRWHQLDQDQAADDRIDLCAKKGRASQRFVSFGKGHPAIQKATSPTTSGGASQSQSLILLTDINAVMTEIIQLLRYRNDAESGMDDYSPLVENLTRLMKTLGDAANGMHLR